MGDGAAIPRDYLDYNSVTIGTSAAVIKSANRSRLGIAVCNLGAATIYLGKNTDVTTAIGFPLLSNQSIYFDGYVGAVWGVSGSAGNTVHWLEV